MSVFPYEKKFHVEHYIATLRRNYFHGYDGKYNLAKIYKFKTPQEAIKFTKDKTKKFKIVEVQNRL